MEGDRVLNTVRIVSAVAAGFVLCAPFSGHAQTDLNAVKRAVTQCVAQVRQEATRRENFDQTGLPPMWRDFDAYVSPDGKVHNNVRFVGEQDGEYRFKKCLAHQGFSLGPASANNPPPPPAPCSEDEHNAHPGDCWIKLSVWEKRLAFSGFESGWVQSYEFAERQQYNRLGSSYLHFIARLDPG